VAVNVTVPLPTLNVPAGADTVKVLTHRDGKAVTRAIDLPAIFRGGDATSNIQIENGDTIYVERAPVFYIYGEVTRAGAYRLEPGLTVMQAISLGGGITPRGSDRRLKLRRAGADGKIVETDASLRDAVKADDVIYVKESLF